jgi:hypothetical protein
MLRWVFSLMAVALALPAQTLTLFHIDDGHGNSSNEGWSLARLGDLTGDGITEIVVGSTDPVLGPGRVRIINVATGAIVREHLGETFGSQFGYATDGGFDVDMDGVNDVLVGAPGFDIGTAFDNRGRAYLFSGATGTLIWSVTGAVPQENAGSAVAFVGDVNSDGRPDFAVGFQGAASLAGRVEVRSGLDNSIIRSIPGSLSGERLGTSVAYAGDLTGDGIPDLLASAPYHSVNSIAGRVYVFAMPTGTLVRTLDGTQAAEHAGWGLCSIADITGDGVRDVIVGSPDYDSITLTDAGRARAFSGSDGAFLWSFTGPLIHMKAGIDVDGTSDLDGDGIADVVVGVPYIPP